MTRVRANLSDNDNDNTMRVLQQFDTSSEQISLRVEGLHVLTHNRLGGPLIITCKTCEARRLSLTRSLAGSHMYTLRCVSLHFKDYMKNTSTRFLALGRDTLETLTSPFTRSQEARKLAEIESKGQVTAHSCRLAPSPSDLFRSHAIMISLAHWKPIRTSI